MTLTRSLERASAIRKIETDRDDLFAVDIAGEVVAADVENLYGLLEGACALHERIDVLVRATELVSIDWEGIADETIVSGQERAQTHVRRCAAVGGPDWTAKLGKETQVEIRYFDADNEADAWTWLEATPKPV